MRLRSDHVILDKVEVRFSDIGRDWVRAGEIQVRSGDIG